MVVSSRFFWRDGLHRRTALAAIEAEREFRILPLPRFLACSPGEGQRHRRESQATRHQICN